MRKVSMCELVKAPDLTDKQQTRLKELSTCPLTSLRDEDKDELRHLSKISDATLNLEHRRQKLLKQIRKYNEELSYYRECTQSKD